MNIKKNFIAEFILKNFNSKYFYILKSKIFIVSFLCIFSWGAYYSYSNANMCRINGQLQLNPVYTPPELIANEIFIIKQISKNYPEIVWEKRNFYLVGPKKSSDSYCIKIISKFENEISDNYNKILDNINYLSNNKNVKIILNNLKLDDNKTDTLIKINELEKTFSELENNNLKNNPDRFIFEWRIRELLTASYLLTQIILICIFAFILSIFISTIFDLVKIIKLKKK